MPYKQPSPIYFANTELKYHRLEASAFERKFADVPQGNVAAFVSQYRNLAEALHVERIENHVIRSMLPWIMAGSLCLGAAFTYAVLTFQ